MADVKWIDGLEPSMSIRAAARLALANRLEVVRDRLPAAALRAREDVEHVHQLRVGTRRAAAALRIFEDCLPARLHKKVRKSLRSIRRSAGAARDWDVFLEMVQPRLARAPAAHRAGVLFLFGYGQGQRDLAQDELQKAHRDHADAFAAAIDEVKTALDNGKATSRTLADAANQQLTELLRDLESAASADLQSYPALHQVRILGKKLRYAMEIFACCYDHQLREHYYPAVEDMQDILGFANDSFTACERLGGIRKHLEESQPKVWPKCRGGIESLIEFHEKRLPQQRRKFEKWWRAWLKSGAEKAFAELVRES